MRKQYHSRHTERGNLIWDVDRLVELSKSFSKSSIPLSSLKELDEPYWFDGPDAVPTCRAVADHARLMRETDLSHPIILSSDGRVMDGMHRIAKAYMLGRDRIDAVRFTVDPEPDFVDVPLESLSYEESPGR